MRNVGRTRRARVVCFLVATAVIGSLLGIGAGASGAADVTGEICVTFKAKRAAARQKLIDRVGGSTSDILASPVVLQLHGASEAAAIDRLAASPKVLSVTSECFSSPQSLCGAAGIEAIDRRSARMATTASVAVEIAVCPARSQNGVLLISRVVGVAGSCTDGTRFSGRAAAPVDGIAFYYASCSAPRFGNPIGLTIKYQARDDLLNPGYNVFYEWCIPASGPFRASCASRTDTGHFPRPTTTTTTQPPSADGWRGWNEIKSCGKGTPRVSNARVAVSVVYVGCDNHLYRRVSHNQGASWDPEEDLGFPGGCVAGSPMAAGNATRIDVYARQCGTTILWHRAKTGDGAASAWGAWEAIPNLCVHSTQGDPTAVSYSNALIVHVVGCGSDIVQLWSVPDTGAWNREVVPTAKTGSVCGRPRPVWPGDGVYVFYTRCGDGQMRYTKSADGLSPWADSQPVGEARCIQGEPGAISKSPGVIDVYGIDCPPGSGTSPTTDALMHTRFENGSWSPWLPQNPTTAGSSRPYYCHKPGVAITSYRIHVWTVGCETRRVFQQGTDNGAFPGPPANLEGCSSVMPGVNWTANETHDVLMIAVTGCDNKVSFGRWLIRR